jgi:hypothetical protein
MALATFVPEGRNRASGLVTRYSASSRWLIACSVSTASGFTQDVVGSVNGILIENARAFELA